jgi:hypothetical protein
MMDARRDDPRAKEGPICAWGRNDGDAQGQKEKQAFSIPTKWHPLEHFDQLCAVGVSQSIHPLS